MGPLGAQEMIAIFILALLLFGPKKLPELGRLLGKGLSEFRRAKSELKATFETHLHELEREAQALNQPQSKQDNSGYSTARYPYPYEEPNQYNELGDGSSAAPSQIEAPANTESAAISPVAEAVPRSNGYKPLELAENESKKEDHPA